MTHDLLEVIKLRQYLEKLIKLQMKSISLNEQIDVKNEELSFLTRRIEQIYADLELKPEYQDPEILYTFLEYLYRGKAFSFEEAIEVYEKEKQE